MKKMQSKFSEMSRKDKRALLICLVFLLCMGIYLGLVDPMVRTHASLVREEKTLLDKKRKYARQAKILMRREQRLLEDRAEYADLLQRLDIESTGEAEITHAMDEIGRYGRMLNVTLEGIRPLEEEGHDLYREFPLEVSFRGDFGQIKKFLYYLETSPAVLMVTDLELNREAKEMRGRVILSKITIPYLEEEVVHEMARPTLRIAVGLSPANGPFFIAREKGWLQKGNLHIQLINRHDQVTAQRFLLAGEIDGVGTTLGGMVNILEMGLDSRIVALVDWSDGSEAIVVNSDESINAVRALKGKTVYLEKSGSGHYLLFRALQMNGMQLGDLKVEQMGPKEVSRSIEAGLIQAGITSDPYLSKAIKESRRTATLFTSKQTPGEIMEILVLRQDVMAGTKGEAVEVLVSGFYSALSWWRDHPEAGNRIVSKAVNMPLVQLKETLKNIRFPTNEDIRHLVCRVPGSTNRIHEFIQKRQDYFKATLGHRVSVPKAALVDWRFLRKAVGCERG